MITQHHRSFALALLRADQAHADPTAAKKAPL